MSSSKKIKLIILIFSVALFVLLFLAPKNKPVSDEKETPVSSKKTDASIEVFVAAALKTLSIQEKTVYDSLLTIAKTNTSDSAYKNVATFWDSKKRPDFAALFVEKNAELAKTDEAFVKAGNRYFYAVRFAQDNNEIPVLYQNAIKCYQKALDINPKNVDAKIQLASCFVEEGSDPMKGIGLLREVEKTDSNNVKLQLNFAFFSVKSGQLEKAISRFEKVLNIDPLFIEAYLHLADVYEQQGNTAKTIEMLEKYTTLTDDAMAKQEIRKYITQLKNK